MEAADVAASVGHHRGGDAHPLHGGMEVLDGRAVGHHDHRLVLGRHGEGGREPALHAAAVLVDRLVAAVRGEDRALGCLLSRAELADGEARARIEAACAEQRVLDDDRAGHRGGEARRGLPRGDVVATQERWRPEAPGEQLPQAGGVLASGGRERLVGGLVGVFERPRVANDLGVAEQDQSKGHDRRSSQWGW